jgi:hypothetical protein
MPGEPDVFENDRRGEARREGGDDHESISFTPDYTRTMIIPQAPLPSSTTMAIAVSGVTSQAGVAVASQTTHFHTMAGPDFSPPVVVHTSVDNSQVVGTNAVFAMQFKKRMDQGSVNPGGTKDVYLYDNTLGYVAVTFSFRLEAAHGTTLGSATRRTCMTWVEMC